MRIRAIVRRNTVGKNSNISLNTGPMSMKFRFNDLKAAVSLQNTVFLPSKQKTLYRRCIDVGPRRWIDVG